MNIDGRIALGLLVAAAIQSRATAQDETRLSMRVTTAVRGSIVIDRGARDALLIGDRVNLYPRVGGAYRGTVTRVDDRSAIVVPDEPDYVPEPGTRGEVLVPRSRASAPPPIEEPPPPPPLDPNEHPPWQERSDEWQAGMPLLAKVRPVRPSERAPRLTGRVWTLMDYVNSANDGRGSRNANSFLRVGTAMTLDNAFGRGEVLDLDLEVHDNAGFDDDFDTQLLVRSFSYREGGTRFEPNRWQLGRFLQYAIPEFGIVDGIEWNRRTESGDHFGASIGFLPNPDQNLSTGDDFQFAGTFHWAVDPQELVTFDFGYQKTFHHGDADRDLFVVKTRILAGDGYDLYGSASIDAYLQSRDDAKDQVLELTMAYVTLRRTFDDGAGWDLSYRRRAFPLTLRNEFEPVTLAEIAEDHVDLLSLQGRTSDRGTDRWLGEISGWVDEGDSGGAIEGGRVFANSLFEDDELEFDVFATLGSFESVVGLRVMLGRDTTLGRWDLLYEFSNHHLDGRDSDADDLFQHRVRAAQSFQLESGWSLSCHGDAVLWDDDLALALGFHVQKAF